ncbi:unnamed protein product, partial [Heterobilharzia americana]
MSLWSSMINEMIRLVDVFPVISSLSLTLSNNQSEQLSSISTSEETNCTIVPGKL